MSTRLLASLSLAAALVACKAPPKAPADLDSLSVFLYREWDNELPSVMEDGVQKLDAILSKLGDGQYENDPNANQEGRSFTLTTMTRDDLTKVTIPEGQDPKTCQPLSVARLSKWAVEDHARLQSSTDQKSIEPTATVYVRTFPDTDKPECLVDRSCLVLKTENEVTRANPFISVTFKLHKQFRWVKLGADRWVLISRSWTDKVFTGKDPNTAMNQSYGLDVWVQQPNGKTWRYQALYSDTKLSFDPGPDAVAYTVVSATDEIFKKADEVIESRYH